MYRGEGQGGEEHKGKNCDRIEYLHHKRGSADNLNTHKVNKSPRPDHVHSRTLWKVGGEIAGGRAEIFTSYFVMGCVLEDQSG